MDVNTVVLADNTRPKLKSISNDALRASQELEERVPEALVYAMSTWRQRWERSTQSSASSCLKLSEDLQSTQVRGIVGCTALDTVGHQWIPAVRSGPLERILENVDEKETVLFASDCSNIQFSQLILSTCLFNSWPGLHKTCEFMQTLNFHSSK